MSYKPKILVVAEGGTGLATLTAHALQVGNGTGNVTQLSVGADNLVLTGNTNSLPSWQVPKYLTDYTQVFLLAGM